MTFPFFISKKYIFSKRDSRFISFISTVSIAGIALGVATLIIALSILKGFEDTITKKIIDFDSHIKITSYKTTLPNYHIMLPRIEKMLGKYLQNISPYASKLAILGSKKIKEGTNIKGIMPDDESLNLRRNIIEGKFDFSSDKMPAIIIGKKLADKLLVSVGDKVTAFALAKDEIPSIENFPNIQNFRVTGIFESGMAEYDDMFAYVSLNEAQKLFEIDDNITGYDIKLNDVSKIDSLTNYLNEELRYPHSVRSIYQIHRNIFTWIQLQKEPIPLILALIVLVAVFNIIGTLLMIVLEKTNAVGTLKSLGATGKQIVSIFVLQGFYLALVGIVAGNLIALILTELQLRYKLISIPSSVYFMSSVPILLTPSTFIIVSVLTLILALVVSLIPSYIASKIQPVKALRFD